MDTPSPHDRVAASLREYEGATKKDAGLRLIFNRLHREDVRRYLAAHENAGRKRRALMRRFPVDEWLLELDASYQRLRARTQHQAKFAPGPGSLSGRRSVLSVVQAVEMLRDLSERNARKGSAGTFSEVAARVLELRDHPSYRALLDAHVERSRAMGPALRVERALVQLPGEARLSGPGDDDSADSPDTGNGSTWTDSIVRIFRKGQFTGTGFFVRPAVIVTAAHVLRAPGTSAPSADQFQVQAPTVDGNLGVDRIRITTGWTPDHPDLDSAMLSVAPVDGVGLPMLWDFGASGGDFSVARYGYPADGSEEYGSGAAHRVDTLFYTSDADLQIPAGASGCPLLYESSGTVHAVGIGTARSTTPSQTAFIGLPFRHSATPPIES